MTIHPHRVLISLVFVMIVGLLMPSTSANAQKETRTSTPWNPCDTTMMDGPGDWAVFHRWRFEAALSVSVDSLAEKDMLGIEKQCPEVAFKKVEPIRRHDGSNAVTYTTRPGWKFGWISFAYFRGDGGIVRMGFRAGTEEAGRHFHFNFVDIVAKYGEEEGSGK